jgi:hypothetical protein
VGATKTPIMRIRAEMMCFAWRYDMSFPRYVCLSVV